jgi:hypothetical protein
MNPGMEKYSAVSPNTLQAPSLYQYFHLNTSYFPCDSKGCQPRVTIVPIIPSMPAAMGSKMPNPIIEAVLDRQKV